MVPRTRTAFFSADMTVPEMVERFQVYRHPRVPVFRGHRDNLVGFVHAEDILRLVLDRADLSAIDLADIIHPPVVVPLTKKVDEMFDFFQVNNARAAAVLNEFGGVEGFVTMKDVLTFIFGQISGEVEGQELYRERDENVYEVDGAMKLTDFNNLTNFGIEDPRMTTIGGVAFRHLDRLPKVGDSVAVEGIVIRVLDMDEHRIARVRVSRGQAVEGAAAEEAVEEELAAEASGTGEGSGATSALDEEADEDTARTSGTEKAVDDSVADIAEEGVSAADNEALSTDAAGVPSKTEEAASASSESDVRDREPTRKVVD
jgi:Mg2+/Co2+ transporter CorC